MADAWIQRAVGREGKLRKHFGVKEGQKIPLAVMDKEIARLHARTRDAGGPGLSAEEQRLLAELNLAKRLRSCGGSKR
jgi:hypothetical protein